MVTRSIEQEFEKQRVCIQRLKMSKEKQSNFFWSEWN